MNKPLKLALVLAALVVVIGVWYVIPQRDPILRQLWGLNESSYQEFAVKLKARKAAKLEERFGFTLGDSLPPTPEAHPAGGLHGGPVRVTLSLPGGPDPKRMPVFYTLDGSVPTRRDRRYEGPIPIDTHTVLRFRALPEDKLPGVFRTEAYFIAPHPALPVLSIATDPVNLWNKYSGIYENPLEVGRSWERQADVHYLAAGGPSLSLTGELRIHGGYSRRVPKKSFRFRFPVAGKLPLPEGHPLVSTAWKGENTVVIRAGGEAHSSRIRDALSALLYSRSGGHASALAPVFVYLNGQAWGVYDLRERIDVGYLRSRFGEGDYELIGFDSKNKNRWGTPIVGKKKHWEKTLKYFRENSLEDSARFAAAAALVDVDGTFDYWIHNVYAANVDWPYNNFNAFRKEGVEDGRWKWISWDVDGSFDDQGKGLDHNTLEWSLRDRVRNDLKWNYEPGLYEDKPTYLVSTLVMRRFLENREARGRFLRRALDLLNTAYRPAPTLDLLDSLMGLTEADRPRDFARWGWKDADFREDMGKVAAFIRLRPDIVRGHLAKRFDLGKPAEVKVRLQGSGRVRLNSLTLSDSAWTGTYLEGMELHFAAEPAGGSAFAGWRGLPGAARDRAVRLAGPLEVTAVFTNSPGPVTTKQGSKDLP